MEKNDSRKEQLFQEIEGLIIAVNTILTKEYRTYERGNDLTVNQQMLIFLIGKQNINSVKALAQELNVSPSAVSQTLAKLEKMNIVKRGIDLEDRRNVCIELETEGIEILEEMEKIRSSIFTKYFSKIENNDLEHFKKIYEKFYNIILEEHKEA